MDDIRGKSVLVIDDDPNLLKLVARVFTQAGAQVHAAPNAQEGLHLFSAHQPDLVLLDVMLPEIDGWEVCRQIRQRSKVPIIMLTVLDQDEHVAHGVECGADEYVTKPFSADVLLARVRAVLRRTNFLTRLKRTAPDT